MQLKIQRSQRTTGVVTKTTLFCVDARVELTAQQQADIQKYKLGRETLYASEAAKNHAAQAGTRGLAHALYHAAATRMNLIITVEGLQRGQHIECKSLEEVLGAEEALIEACRNLKNNLDIAATFDGREIIINIDDEGQQKAA